MTTVAKAIPATCKVVAPATLKANSTFEATVDGITFTVTVPEYGADEGESLTVPYPAAPEDANLKKYSAPTVKFRSGLYSCCQTFGSVFFMAWLCTPCVIGQVIERINLGWGGCPRIYANGNPDKRPSPPICMCFAAVSLLLLVISVAALVMNVPYGFIFLGIWAWYMMAVTTCTRYNMRKKFRIEGSCCGNGCCGDCFAAYFCPCCSVHQMITHTHNQEEYPYSWRTRTGLRPDAPVIV